MSNLPDFAKISPEIAEISKDALTKIGFQLTKSDETRIDFTKGNLSAIVAKTEIYDIAHIVLKLDNPNQYFDLNAGLEYYFTGNSTIYKSMLQQYYALLSTEEYKSLDQAEQREQVSLLLVKKDLEMVEQFLPEIENNFDPEKYFAWRDANLNMPFKV